jgi:hypothetical protein
LHAGSQSIVKVSPPAPQGIPVEIASPSASKSLISTVSTISRTVIASLSLAGSP